MKERDIANEQEIDLLELAGVVLGRWYIVLPVAILGAIIAVAYSLLLVTPMYTSSTSIYILSKQNQEVLTTNDLYISAQLGEDSTILVKSRSVMKAVVDKMGLEIAPETLSRLVNVTTTSDSSRIIQIAVTYPNPQMAENIADCVREEASVKFVETMDLKAVNLVDEANIPKLPSNNRTTRNTMLGFMLGFMLSAGGFIAAHLLNTRLRTEEDVERYLGLCVLSVIPDSNSGKNTEELVNTRRNSETVSAKKGRKS